MENRPKVNKKMRRACLAFSLLELSVVIAIMSIVAVLGLETANQIIARRAYRETQEKLVALDQAIVQFYRVNGRIPCAATRTELPSSGSYGLEPACGATPLRVGTIPFRAMSIPEEMTIDGYGNRINYVHTRALSLAASFSAIPGMIEIRTGIQQQPCTTNCSLLADPAGSTGAAYILFSSGADGRGAISADGYARAACYTSLLDTRVDTVNCAQGALTIGIASTVYYDSRFNNGAVLANYFDDIVIWRTKPRVGLW